MKPPKAPRFSSKATPELESGEISIAAIPAWAEVDPKRNVPPALLHSDWVQAGKFGPCLAARRDDAAEIPVRSATAAYQPASRGALTAEQNRLMNNLSCADKPACSDRVFRSSTAPLLTVDDAAHLLAVSVKTIRRLIGRGELPSVRIGRAVRIRPEGLQALVEQRVR